MLKDLANSDQFMKEYRAIKGDQLAKLSNGVDVHFHVLSSNCWPITQSINCTIPKVISSCHETFETYYKSRNQGKCIRYCVQMCTALIQASFSKISVKLLDLGGIQAIILLTFNDLPADN